MKASPYSRSLETASTAGFTLVELLSVIVVIGILAALIIPITGSVRAAARSSQCQSNLRQIGAAALMYTADNKGIVLPVYYPAEKTADPLDLRHWPGLLARYIGRTNTTTPFSSYTEQPVFNCPDRPDTFGYGHNYNWLSPYTPQPGNPVVVTLIRYNQVAAPSRTALIMDINVSDSNAWRPFVRPASQGKWRTNEAYSVAFRHRGGQANVVWLDGHVSAEMGDTAFTNDDRLWDRD